MALSGASGLADQKPARYLYLEVLQTDQAELIWNWVLSLCWRSGSLRNRHWDSCLWAGNFRGSALGTAPGSQQGNGIRHREKFKCDVDTTEASADLQGALGLEWPFRVFLNWEKGAFVPLNQPVFECGLPLARGCNLNQSSSLGPERTWLWALSCHHSWRLQGWWLPSWKLCVMVSMGSSPPVSVSAIRSGTQVNSF